MTSIKINPVPTRKGIQDQKKLAKKYARFKKLIDELRKRDLAPEIISSLNEKMESLNAISDTDKQLSSLLRKTQNSILKILQKELKIVPKNYYRNLWMGMGMVVFGVPIGIALSAGINNYGMLGAGMAIGLGIGLAVGSEMDRKAGEEGRQLNVVL
ncbi:hypothetical protein [uncultured Muriicola sp.]|uniref:hypothetical protein n=1 Tax=uncultured Muriicola sp. TaxID=1583102 RepID=UPI00261354F3|nr:hypothetical protein [uncultured Muriicola sp.]